MGQVKAKSACVGDEIRSCFPAGYEDRIEPVVIFRDGRVLEATNQTRLAGGDRVLLVAPSDAGEALRQRIETAGARGTNTTNE